MRQLDRVPTVEIIGVPLGSPTAESRLVDDFNKLAQDPTKHDNLKAALQLPFLLDPALVRLENPLPVGKVVQEQQQFGHEYPEEELALVSTIHTFLVLGRNGRGIDYDSDTWSTIMQRPARAALQKDLQNMLDDRAKSNTTEREVAQRALALHDLGVFCVQATGSTSPEPDPQEHRVPAQREAPVSPPVAIRASGLPQAA